jgi:hypothetical protein
MDYRPSVVKYVTLELTTKANEDFSNHEIVLGYLAEGLLAQN